MDEIPPQLMDSITDEWKVYLLWAFVLSQVLGRAYKGIKTQGGLLGIINGIWFGTNQQEKKNDEN